MLRRVPLPMDEPDRVADLEAEVAKLRRINAALIDRVERSTDLQGNAFSLFETAISLEAKVRDRTTDLERALSDLARSNAELGTARDLADDARRRLKDAIESINEGFVIFDADDRLVLCNQTYLGLWPKIADRIVPGLSFDDIARLIGGDGTTLGALVAPDRWISERVRQHAVADGSHVHVLADGRWIQVNELRTSEGGIVGVYTDITNVKVEDARDRARELAEKSAILQATLDTIPQGVCVYDKDRRLIAWNDPLLATIGLPLEAIDRLATHASLVATCVSLNGPIASGDPLGWLPPGAAEQVERRYQASGRIIEVRRARMPDGGMVMSFADISESLRAAEALKETNETLERRVDERTIELQQEIGERLAIEAALRDAKTIAEQANFSKTRFLAAASHDLLQPLNAARLFVAALSDRRLALPTRALVSQAGSALDSVEQLLEALLEISRLDAGAINPEPVDFGLDELLESMRAEFAPMARERGLALRIDSSGRWVRSDPRLLRRILQNFIANGLRYTPAGHVEVTCALAGDRLRIEVADTGIGIAPEHQAEIFEEFRRLENGTSERGMGLGLAVVERASRMLGHPVHLRSTPGEGSAFAIEVPLGVPIARAMPPGGAIRQGQLTGRIVLCIDNDGAILDGMAAMLGGWGCTVATARHVGEALAWLRDAAVTPDVIIADYHLDRDETGDDAVDQLRAAAGGTIPALIITADRMPELRDRLTRAGLFVLTKPTKPAQLRALLSRLMR